MGWIVSKELSCIFIHIPKTAGSSIGEPNYRKFRKGFLIKYLGNDDIAKAGHIKGIDLKEKYKDCWEDYFKFCFIRNPWDRFVSAYIYSKQKISSIYSRVNSTSSYKMRRSTFGSQLQQCHSFRDFCIKLEQFDLDIHFEPQVDYITDSKENLLVDFIGKYENLNQDFKKICETIGLPGKVVLPHFRNTKHKIYREYYDNETKKIVEKYYEKDIEMFKYQF